MKTLLLLASLFFATCFCPSLRAEEIKFPSPNGRFALRITESNGEDSGKRKVEIIEKASGRVVTDLGEPWQSQILVWSPDSKWAAFANRGYKAGEVSVYFWNGSNFQGVPLPDELPSPDIKFPKKIGSLKSY